MPCACRVPTPDYPANAAWGPILWQILHGIAEKAGRAPIPADEVREWIQTSRAYITNLAQTYNNLCDNEERHLNHTIDQRAKCASVRLDFIGMLPLDVIRHIKKFLLPEIQTQLYISCYPNMNEMLSKLTVYRLKTY